MMNVNFRGKSTNITLANKNFNLIILAINLKIKTYL